MKKVLIAICLALLLTGCANNGNDASITKEDIIWTSEDKTFTSKDLYKILKTQSYSSIVLNGVFTKIAEKENIDLETMREDLRVEYKNYIDAGLGDYLASYYPNEDAYVKAQLFMKIEEELINKAVTEEYDEYVANYSPYKAEIAYFDTYEIAQTVVNMVNEGTNTFAYAASENGYTGTISESIYTDDSDFPIELKEVINKTEKGLSEIVTTSMSATDSAGNTTVTQRHYVVNIISKNVEEFKDEFITYIANNYYTESKLVNKYFTKYNVVIHDQTTYELLKGNYEGIKVD